jgi:hypothetical protein
LILAAQLGRPPGNDAVDELAELGRLSRQAAAGPALKPESVSTA